MDFQHMLERLRVYSQKPCDHEDQIKVLTTKLLAKIRSSDKSSRDRPTRMTICNNLDVFTTILQSTQNLTIIGNIAIILQDLLETKATKKKSLTSLQVNGSSSVMFQLLPVIAQETYCPENILPAVFSTLLKLASKDPQFANKIRSSGGLTSIMTIVKSNTRNSMLLKYLMQVLKICLRNPTNCAIMGKEGLVASLITVIMYTGRRTTFILKLALEVVGLLVKNKNNVTRLLRHNGLPKHLHILEGWDRYDGENKLKICKANLTVLGCVAEYPNGLRAITDAAGIPALYKFCVNLPQSVEHDNLLILGSVVLQKCLPRVQLPVPTICGPYNFPIPTGRPYPATITVNTKGTWSSDSAVTKYTTDLNVSGSSEDEDEDKEIGDGDVEGHGNVKPSDIATQCELKAISEDLKNANLPDAESIERSSLSDEELHPYKIFFRELDCSVFNDFGSENLTHKRNDKKWRGDTPHRWVCREEVYKEMSSNTKHVASFVKLAYPDMNSGGIYQELEPLYDKDPAVCRMKLLESLNRSLQPPKNELKIVYDLDECHGKVDINPYESLNNDDDTRVGKRDTSVPHLKFESRFESGNLRKAIQIGPQEYELILTPDMNTSTHIQWFYFEVSNMDAVLPYTFHIVNCEKQTSQFNYGMKPVMYSVKEAVLGRPGWIRYGTDICYYKNIYFRERPPSDETQEKCYYTASFTVLFPHAYDVCYFAYHFPYTYTTLQADMYIWDQTCNRDDVYFVCEELCKSLAGNSVPVTTITSANHIGRDKRHYVFLTSRVHPGETNASWVLRGCIEFLLSNKSVAQNLRDLYIFKIVPMLNPDGVINGCHRCDLTAEDMNRCWLQPSPILQPSIYHTKALLLYLASISKSPLVYCDFHGHSRKKNIFLYGCCNNQSWCEIDRLKEEESNHELLPKILNHLAPAFSMESCQFNVERIREATARVTVWRQIKVQASYTMESSYCGCDQGRYEGMHLGIKHQEEMGFRFCHALIYLHPQRCMTPTSSVTKVLQNELKLHLKMKSEDQFDFSDGEEKFDRQNHFVPIKKIA